MHTLTLGWPATGTAPAREVDAVVARARAGDPDAFGQLYHAHVGRVYALCLRLEGDSARAEERTQDVFVRAWERLASFRGESAFGTWLHRLAVNVVLGHRRSAWRRERRFLEADAPGAAEVAAPSSRPCPCTWRVGP